MIRAAAIVLAFAMLLFALVFAAKALAHDWYPRRCCSDRDCRVIEPAEYELTASGYRILATGEVVAYGTEQMSPDGAFHRCSWGGRPDSKTIGLSYGKPCFWAPMMGAQR